MNTNCNKCDYTKMCKKRVRLDDGSTVFAKEQDLIDLECIYVVQDMCKNCDLFKSHKCAYWKVAKGKEQIGDLVMCAKKGR